jgi:hypothetical protein
MTRKPMAMLCAATLAIAAVGASTSAEARNGRIAAGIIGGIAAGALMSGAFGGPYYYGPSPYYDGPGYFYGPPPFVYGPSAYYWPRCVWQSHRYWNGHRWRVTRGRVCY